MRRRPGLVLTLSLSGCLGDPPAVSREEAIYYGQSARGYGGVVRVRLWRETFNAGSCSGTLVAPRVVVTARHCIEDSDPIDVAVEIGPEGELGAYGVDEIRTTEGTLEDDNDFALLLLPDRVDAPPFPYAREWSPVEEASITLVGYGRSEINLVGLGLQHVGQAEVGRWSERYFVTRGESNGCYGDSGGAGFDEQGTLVGVISHILYGLDPDDECDHGSTGLNRVDAYADLVDGAVADTAVCEELEYCGEEIDDDCDGRADDGCTALGEACLDTLQCETGECHAIDGTSLCVAPCYDDRDCPERLACEDLADGARVCREPSPEPDAAVPDASVPDGGGGDGGENGGCACRWLGPVSDNGPSAWLLLLLGLAISRRRAPPSGSPEHPPDAGAVVRSGREGLDVGQEAAQGARAAPGHRLDADPGRAVRHRGVRRLG